MHVAAWSVESRLGDVAANVETVRKAIPSADLVLFPELFLTGYTIGDEVERLAFATDDDRLAPLRDVCKDGHHLIVGAPWTPRRGIIHNAALLIDDKGKLHWYAKRVLATFTTFQEGLFYKPGTKSPVWKTSLGRIGPSICYDLYFPEFQKLQVLDGADLLVNISASPATSRRFFEALLAARAIENASFSLYSNHVGAQDGVVFWGGSRGYGPRGQLLGEVEAYEAGHATFDIDLDDVRAARAFRPTLRDSDRADTAKVARRPEDLPRGVKGT